MSKAKTKPASAPVAPIVKPTDEVESIARMMAASYRSMVRYYRQEYGLEPAEADARTRACADNEYEQLMERPCDQIYWGDLGRLTEKNKDQAVTLWEYIKQVARDELRSGHRTADVMEHNARPFHRAQFLAIRQAFIDEWQPRGGIELALIDTMAQSYQSYLMWLNGHVFHSEIEEEREKTYYEKMGKRQAKRETVLLYLEQSFQMMDRFNRLFLRTLRQLRDLRRYSVPVTINNPQQVNIAADGGQQVNVAGEAGNPCA